MIYRLHRCGFAVQNHRADDIRPYDMNGAINENLKSSWETYTHFAFQVHRIDKKSEGGIILPDIGYIEVNAYTSNARIPLEDVAITVTAEDGTAIAMRLTDRNGLIRAIEVPVPSLSAGQTPDTGIRPYTPVNLYARLEGYEQLENENLQVFPDTVTRLDLQMIPLSELPGSWDQVGITDTPPQNL